MQWFLRSNLVHNCWQMVVIWEAGVVGLREFCRGVRIVDGRAGWDKLFYKCIKMHLCAC
jgi:hypothetical protein